MLYHGDRICEDLNNIIALLDWYMRSNPDDKLSKLWNEILEE